MSTQRLLVLASVIGLSILVAAACSSSRATPQCEGTSGFTDGDVYLVDSSASGEAWVDGSGDGRRGTNEHPLEGVCLWASTTLREFSAEEISRFCEDPEWQEAYTTDVNGEWPTGEWSFLFFYAGACCGEVYVYAVPPDGHRETTPLVVNDCYAQFGFVPAETSPGYDQYSHSYYVEQMLSQQE